MGASRAVVTRASRVGMAGFVTGPDERNRDRFRRGRRGRATRRLVTVAALLLLLDTGAADAACTLNSAATWIDSNGNWAVNGNWSTGSFPNSAATNACITDGTSTVTLTDSVSVASLQLDAGNTLNINTGNHTLNVNGSQIINAGTMNLNGGGNADGVLNIAGTTVTLSGGGTLSMSAGGGGNAFIRGNNNTLVNADNTIQGVGIIGNGSLAVVNGGPINANTTAGYGSLSLDGSGGITNVNGTTGGLLAATNSGKLDINTTVVNAVGNTGGNITANGGTVFLDGATI